MHKNCIDKTGKKYGKLVVLSYEGKQKWLCQCECGKRVKVKGSNLANGHTASCGSHRTAHNFKDRTGKRYGRLLALEYKGNRKWLCRCDCGKECEVGVDSLRSGHTKSCGCYRPLQSHQPFYFGGGRGRLKDEAGKRYGHVLVLKYNYNNGKWICRCDCGEQCEISGGRLRSTPNVSCGRGRGHLREDLTGRRFGRLVVVEYDKAKWQWNCLCDCGSHTAVHANALFNHKIVSCGCFNAEQMRKKLTKHGLSYKSKEYYVYCKEKGGAEWRIKKSVSGNVRTCLKRNGGDKFRNSCWKYLPFTPLELKEHLEGQFEPWMSWDNYGGCMNDKRKTWWIDHIKPQSSFHFTSMSDPEFKKCWSLSNLRPLEKHENASKGDSLIF